MLPIIENIYSSIYYISITYKGETKVLKFSIFLLYSIPELPINLDFPPSLSDFSKTSDAWLPADSIFKFTDNEYDYGFQYGESFFAEFIQEAQQN
jgi:hypothetical protein